MICPFSLVDMFSLRTLTVVEGGKKVPGGPHYVSIHIVTPQQCDTVSFTADGESRLPKSRFLLCGPHVICMTPTVI